MLLPHLITPLTKSEGPVQRHDSKLFQGGFARQNSHTSAEWGILLWIIRHQQVPRTKRPRRYFFRRIASLMSVISSTRVRSTDTPESSSWEATSTSGSERKADTIHSPSDTIDVYQEKGVTKEKRVAITRRLQIFECVMPEKIPQSQLQLASALGPRYVVGHFKVMN